MLEKTHCFGPNGRILNRRNLVNGVIDMHRIDLCLRDLNMESIMLIGNSSKIRIGGLTSICQSNKELINWNKYCVGIIILFSFTDGKIKFCYEEIKEQRPKDNLKLVPMDNLKLVEANMPEEYPEVISIVMKLLDQSVRFRFEQGIECDS
ncbi:uncharacterized protein [Rutidosis leptorrhynchoides]|uniref:uncharacterized protein n=1 Tax=Rutidosis leptorrhynchoides TaxID=125765 RepID=UPI003A991DE2